MPQVVPIHLCEFMAERRYQDDAARSTFLQNQSVNGLANRAYHAETVDSGSIPAESDQASTVRGKGWQLDRNIERYLPCQLTKV